MTVDTKNLIDFLTLSINENDKENIYYDLCTQIDNIVNSYDDEFDAFSELIQNSMDAVIHMYQEEKTIEYKPEIIVTVDCAKNTLSVLDNGCGVEAKDFEIAMRPNASLKKRLRHKNARGEKGAALVFLQFGHHKFEFHSKTENTQKSYILYNGLNWFKETLEILEDNERPFNDKTFPIESYELRDSISSQLDHFETGTYAEVKFGEGCQLNQLQDLFDGDDPLKKLEYILRTRTAIGYFYLRNKDSFLENLSIKIQVIRNNGEKISKAPKKIQPGFLFPHEIAIANGSTVSKFTDLRDNSELLYEFINNDFIENHFKDITKNKEFSNIISKYNINGYFSYGYVNNFYEKASISYMDIKYDKKDNIEDLKEFDLIQVNGGLRIFVKEFPNGRIHSFLHRSGAEHKSRTFVCLNFGGKYKPDYGRKNISDEVRKFVLEFCKALINFASKKENRKMLINGPGTGRDDIRDQKEAVQKLQEESKTLRSKCSIWVESLDLITEDDAAYESRKIVHSFLREPIYEDEVKQEFIWLLQNGYLPGYKIYGLPSVLQLDALFDYYIAKEEKYIYHPVTNTMGLNFQLEKKEIKYENQWIEFKTNSDLLIDDFNKSKGESGKKYFGTIDLLICYQLDDSTDKYEIEEVNDSNKRDQTYYGVTHYLKSSEERSHIIQVIELKTLRRLLKYVK